MNRYPIDIRQARALIDAAETGTHLWSRIPADVQIRCVRCLATVREIHDGGGSLVTGCSGHERKMGAA